jgi:hypothetical protein
MEAMFEGTEMEAMFEAPAPFDFVRVYNSKGDMDGKVSTQGVGSDLLSKVTSLQSIKGHWTDSGKVMELIGSRVKVFDEIQGHAECEKIFASVLALGFLRKHLLSDHSQWELIEKKALAWLARQGVDAEVLIGRAIALIR